ncbi:nitroreductase family deazaflavin-dependent oxidoreductase [Streptomyces sclerotialus]|uniref:nitroreductase family deazaflavin-dependent oxidoreductase n=1 Tax=Streptomyces sclerotialus TaxID=1957 RepID=UPI0034A4B04D
MDAVSAEEQDEDLRGLSALLRAHHHGPDGPGAAGRAPRGHHEGLWRLLARKCGLPGTCEEAGRVLLTSTGAWSGQRRRTPLAYMPEPGGGWILVGGNFGRSGRPAWTAHLLKCPDLEFSWGGRDVPVRTVPLTGGERAAAWRAVPAFWPPYAAYQSRVTREIRLFRLVRR